MARWRKVAGLSEIYKWRDEGQSLEGTWRGSKEGKFGLLGTIETAEGVKVSFPLLRALEYRLKEVREGTLIRMIYKGLEVSQAGREFKAFEVFIAEDDVPEGSHFPLPNASDDPEAEPEDLNSFSEPS